MYSAMREHVSCLRTRPNSSDCDWVGTACFRSDHTVHCLRLLCLIYAAFLIGCASSKPPLRTVTHVDLPKYMGDWRVIANIPYFAEKDCIDSIESYALRPDGRIANSFTF